jgi:hypothetical protein
MDFFRRGGGGHQEGLGQPDAHITLALGPGRAQAINGQPRGDAHQPGFGIADLRAVGLVPA